TQFTGGGGDQVFLGRDIQSDQNYSDAIAHAIDTETQAFINECYARAKEILTTNQDKLELIAKTLLDVETLDAEEIKSLFEDGVLPEKPVASIEEESSDDGNVKVNINTQEEEAKNFDGEKDDIEGDADFDSDVDEEGSDQDTEDEDENDDEKDKE